ncbi:MAG TPA: GNAT family N-acetyltransferase, partial [Planctomycetaceae bacterium]|nr:GNAT family N-acetyltransferase [Planctomycetaceae bacterium]
MEAVEHAPHRLSGRRPGSGDRGGRSHLRAFRSGRLRPGRVHPQTWGGHRVHALSRYGNLVRPEDAVGAAVGERCPPVPKVRHGHPRNKQGAASMSGFHLRNMTPEDREEVARLIYHSTNRYYESIGRDRIFKGDELVPAEMFDVYQRIDPGEGIVAVDDQTGQIIGSCFVHPRETHVSLGIMNSHPDHFGRGVARALLQRIIELAEAQGKPVRLVS